MTDDSTAAGGQGRWTAADMPDLAGRTAVVTGANAGIGFETARALAAHGAQVILACRNTSKAEQAADRIRAEYGRAAAGIVRLDLASLASVREAAEEIRATCPRLDLLLNNAGVMEVPYERTEDGFELTFATNHLGHFALTGLVLDCLLASPGSRIVTMSSMAHHDGVLNFGDLQGERGYQPAAAYSQSKLANLLFTYELDRRLQAAGAQVSALGSHPGVVFTELFRTRSRLNRALLSPWLRVINFWAVQNVHMGALPALRAATDPGARGGEYYGPHRKHGTGYPKAVRSSEASHSEADQARLWQVSEQLTGVSYPVRAAAALP
jgi:NAD(P)-dependent dehydrogenase (short-subunit alcohol dehydrogenase family)